MITYDTIEVPASQETDYKKDFTTWENGKCVRMNEGRDSLYFYNHESHVTTDEQGNETQVTVATCVRVHNPSTPADVLRQVKDDLRQNIDAYDKSDSVNAFQVSGISMWLDKATRSGLMLRLSAESNAGAKTTTLWYGTHQISLPIENAINMLNLLELYASKCYDNTQGHLAAIEALETVEEVLKYDYTSGYPDKLEF